MRIYDSPSQLCLIIRRLYALLYATEMIGYVTLLSGRKL